ncbi:MAG: asparagine synthase (glutamine-hydrolyzing) [Planctomycetes bacterium]|nr:asparagine synthase (glutamine-hydrolyzing) [Planctomycetota bacterium]MBL7039854.1 asparagine synthase (glutamine-hydrolyzing) [Pirellulaceae bacterium]
MCGITGAIWTDPQLAIDQPVLQRMTEVLRHRGPDDGGFYLGEYRLRPPYEAMPGVALGFRRLAIIDVAGGHQPMSNEDDTVWVVFNGEIYNFPELRNRLEGAGHKFKTHSDTEAIVHLYEDEGPDCFRHLNGMFAIAIWDARLRRLVLGRDRLGQKPLVYRHQAGRLAFASELKSLLEIPGAPRDIDPSAIDEYLTYQYVPHPNTIFRGINKLPPGHLAVYCDGDLSVRPYWEPDFNFERSISQAEAIDRLRSTLESSVAMRLQSEVPLGAFLSGGVDSSLIVAIAQQKTAEPLRTFSIGFPVKEYDETSYARLVADHLKTDHHEFQVTPDGVGILPKLVWHYDEPFADSSAIPTWYVSEMTRQHVTVALSGDGGDELFAGYPRYKAVALSASLDRTWPLRRVFGANVWQSLPSSTRQKSTLRRFKRFCEVLSTPPLRRYLDWIGIFNEASRATLYSDDFLGQLPDSDPMMFLESAMSRADQRDPVTAFCLTDLTTYLPCDLMTKVDIASMAHALECRQPFLDYRVVELAASLPIGMKYRRGRGKRLLRAAFGDLLPQEIWTRRKMGFGVPLEHWFRNELRELTCDVLLGETARSRGYFRPEVVQEMVESHLSGKFSHCYRLWSLLVLELWLQRWCDGTP